MTFDQSIKEAQGGEKCKLCKFLDEGISGRTSAGCLRQQGMLDLQGQQRNLDGRRGVI